MESPSPQPRVRIGFRQSLSMIVPYVTNRVRVQIRSVALIVLYMVLFQLLVLRIPVADALVIAVGIAIVTIGLAAFLEGLLVGVMPLGETCGVRLPERANLPSILAFAFVLGVGATLAEPAIGFLKGAGEIVTAWQTPLLFALLTKYSAYLTAAIGVGVGIAVALSMVRFLYNWSLKPILYVIMPLLLLLTAVAMFDPNLSHVVGLAWDSGAITTGPVTVPLVLALGLGVSRITGRADQQISGLGVVTLASAIPILTVLVLGFAVSPMVPKPFNKGDFFVPEERARIERLFSSPDEAFAYVLSEMGPDAGLAYVGGDRSRLIASVGRLAGDRALVGEMFGGSGAFTAWIDRGFSPADAARIRAAAPPHALDSSAAIDIAGTVVRSGTAALKAILPLCFLLIVTITLFLRDRIARFDEILFGVASALVGMFLFNIGMELGLAKLGAQTGSNLPASFSAIPVPGELRVIHDFNPALVQTAINDGGQRVQFFYLSEGNHVAPLPYLPQDYHADSGTYEFQPLRGPLFGHGYDFIGFFIVLLFAFVMGYGATVAEPSLSALGITLEEVTVGIFKRTLLVRAVGVGVGVGMTIGFAKVLWDIPLLWLLVPAYAILLVMTIFSTEEFVSIAWDSAGVTTGPITVPLVISTGLAIGRQIGVADGFGILALASVFPGVAVLAVGLNLTRRQRRLIHSGRTDRW